MRPENASCSCNNSNGNWENCVYSCNPSEQPTGAECQCDTTTGNYKYDTCVYSCIAPLPARATRCDCDTTNGQHINCTYTCPKDSSGNPIYPANAITSSCTCNATTGEYDCSYKACNEADKPTNHVISGSCTCNDLSQWECEYEPCKDSDKPAHAYDCRCVQGEWAEDTCTYNYCDDKTWFSYQKCNPATGVITMDHEPALYVTGGGDVSENGGRVTFTVRLSDMPGNDVPLKLTTTNLNGRVSITEPTGKKIAKADWNRGVTYTVTGLNNSAVDGDLNITFTVTADTSEVGYKGKRGTVSVTVKDDDVPSILVRCRMNAVEPHWAAHWGGTNTTGLNVSCNSKNWDNGIRDDNTCYVKLGQKPNSNVTVKLTGSQGSNYSLPRATINAGSGSSTTIESFTTSNLTFTPSNYNVEQEVELDFLNSKTLSSISSSAPVDYKLTASSSTSSYAAATASTSFKVYPLPSFFVFEYKAQPQSVTLPPGKYRLHAWGASGGAADVPSMALTSDKSAFACYNHSGAGAQVSADLTLNSSTKVYIYTGGVGTCDKSTITNAYNGGGKGKSKMLVGSTSVWSCGGGGGTDFCIGSGCSTYANHWPYRILVAGGGGGGTLPGECRTDLKYGSAANGRLINSYGGGDGGGPNGAGYTYNSHLYAPGGFMNPSGSDQVALANALFGKGMDACAQESYPNDLAKCYAYGGGGGGWYGAYFIGKYMYAGGGSGSSYVFTGSNQGSLGSQSATYKLTNSGSYNGTDRYMPYLQWHGNEPAGYCYEINDASTYYKLGNLGNGYAVIEVLR